MIGSGSVSGSGSSTSGSVSTIGTSTGGTGSDSSPDSSSSGCELGSSSSGLIRARELLVGTLATHVARRLKRLVSRALALWLSAFRALGTGKLPTARASVGDEDHIFVFDGRTGGAAQHERAENARETQARISMQQTTFEDEFFHPNPPCLHKPNDVKAMTMLPANAANVHALLFRRFPGSFSFPSQAVSFPSCDVLVWAVISSGGAHGQRKGKRARTFHGDPHALHACFHVHGNNMPLLGHVARDASW